MCHIIFIHLSVDLGCFRGLAIVNSATMNIGMHISFQIRVFSEFMDMCFLFYQSIVDLVNFCSQQSDSVIYICIYIYTHTHFFHILFHYGLSQDICYNFL